MADIEIEGNPPEERDPEEIDDQFRAIMEGLRTTIPGVTVLFSFLLAVPLQPSFADLSRINSVVFYVAFASAAIAAVLLISPSVHQRVRAPISGIKRRHWGHVMFATKLALLGTVAFMFSIVAVIYLVTSLVFSDGAAIVVAVIAALMAVWSWFYLPIVTFARMK